MFVRNTVGAARAAAAGANADQVARVVERSGGDVAQGIDDAVDDFLDQHAVLAFAHDADHRLGAGGANDETAVAVEAPFRLLDGGADLGGLQRLSAAVGPGLEPLRQGGGGGGALPN